MNPPAPDKNDPVREWRRGSGRPKRDSDSDDDGAEFDRSYTPFCVLALVFATLVFLQAIYLKGDFTRRNQIQAARAQMTESLNKAQTINQMTEAVGRELLVLAEDSPEAAKIIAEFKIQLNQPPQPAK